MFLFQIVEVEMPFDKTKNQRKGFCFITFESEQVVNELLKTPKQTINGKAVSFVDLLSYEQRAIIKLKIQYLFLQFKNQMQFFLLNRWM